MTVTISGTSGITTPGINNSSTLTQTGAVTASNTASFATTISVGAAAPASTGAGVTFPASQSASSDANTLDDYEEGTWTPSVGGSATYTQQTGNYVKIGRLVIASAILVVNSIGSGSQNGISGLPFSCSVNGQGSVGYLSSAATSIVFIQPYVDGNGPTTAYIRGLTSAASSMANPNILGNGTRIDFTIVYETT